MNPQPRVAIISGHANFVDFSDSDGPLSPFTAADALFSEIGSTVRLRSRQCVHAEALVPKPSSQCGLPMCSG